MIDVEEIKGRAMALGLGESYIDTDQCLLYIYGSLIFDLTNYILANPEEYNIEIPEGIEKVYMPGCDSYKQGEPYHFIFPSSCDSVFEKISDMQAGVISCGFDGTYKNSQSARFKNTVFDFRKCDKLKEVSHSFCNMRVRAMLFPDSVYKCTTSFSNFRALKLYMPGLTDVCDHSFNSMDVKELTVGVQHRFELRGFLFSDFEVQKELVFKDVTHANIRAFKNVENVYIEYNLNRRFDDIKRVLIAEPEAMQSGTTTAIKVIEDLNSFIGDFRLNDCGSIGLMHDIDEAIFAYLKWEVDENRNPDIRDSVINNILKISNSFYLSNSHDDVGLWDNKLYYFKAGSDKDVHERDYVRLGAKGVVEVYLEK